MKWYNIILLIIMISFEINDLSAQSDRWQQRVEYKMDIDFNVENHQFRGKQEIKYYNNSPDTLSKIYYHLYFNAFQPDSEMDQRSRNILDPDRRVGDRIYHLSKKEQGYHNIKSLSLNGRKCFFEIQGTIMEVSLPRPIMPHENVKLKMNFESQVPIQIRRSGRDNAEGISYSMSQWYPKLCEYDYQGWHANPYVGREFYGVWGDFDVKIKIDGAFVVAASGVQKTKNSYSSSKSSSRTWNFIAKNVHDFVWTADPDYSFISHMSQDGVELQFYYQDLGSNKENWEKLPAIMDEALHFMNKRYGKYPYPVYKFIQGGDGGMEYPMATLITGNRSIGSLVGVSVHEWMHSWYQMVLGTNESLYPWMDEGFTSFASTEVMNHLRANGLLGTNTARQNPFESSYKSYINYAKSGMEEALSTHADHFETNRAYGSSSYTKGQVFLKQLEYIIGEKKLDKTLLRYFNVWKFKHPNINDFIRIAEKTSGLELDWYKEYWVNTTKTIDYAIYFVKQDQGYEQANIFLSNVGKMPMPLDLEITYSDGTNSLVNIALDMMRGNKTEANITAVDDWSWTSPVYSLDLMTRGKEIISVEIDPSGRLADVNPNNNIWLKRME